MSYHGGWLLGHWQVMAHSLASESLQHTDGSEYGSIYPEPHHSVILALVLVTYHVSYLHLKEYKRNTKGSCRAKMNK